MFRLATGAGGGLSSLFFSFFLSSLVDYIPARAFNLFVGFQFYLQPSIFPQVNSDRGVSQWCSETLLKVISKIFTAIQPHTDRGEGHSRAEVLFNGSSQELRGDTQGLRLGNSQPRRPPGTAQKSFR